MAKVIAEESDKERRPGVDRVVLPDLVLSIRVAIERYGFAEVPYALVAQLLGLVVKSALREAAPVGRLAWEPAALDRVCQHYGLRWELPAERGRCAYPPDVGSVSVRFTPR
jgi:hypothetical protein